MASSPLARGRADIAQRTKYRFSSITWTPLAAVDHLRDAQVGGEAAQRVGVLAVEMPVRAQIEVDHLRAARSRRSRRGRDRRPWSSRASASPPSAIPASCRRARCSSKVPTRPVSMAVMQTSPSPCAPWPSPTGEQRAVGEDRQIERGAGDQLLVVHVAAVAARRRRRDHAPGRRRRHRHHAEERPQRELQAPRQPADHARLVERDVDAARISLKSSGSAPASGRMVL